MRIARRVERVQRINDESETRAFEVLMISRVRKGEMKLGAGTERRRGGGGTFERFFKPIGESFHKFFAFCGNGEVRAEFVFHLGVRGINERRKGGRGGG